MNATFSPAYEVLNPSFRDLNIEQQIQFGINDWLAEGLNGREFFGQSKAQAEAARAAYELA
jgi:hypothetical protein